MEVDLRVSAKRSKSPRNRLSKKMLQKIVRLGEMEALARKRMPPSAIASASRHKTETVAGMLLSYAKTGARLCFSAD